MLNPLDTPVFGTTIRCITVNVLRRWLESATSQWGQMCLSYSTDRFTVQRLGQMALAIALILTVKLVKWAKRWND